VENGKLVGTDLGKLGDNFKFAGSSEDSVWFVNSTNEHLVGFSPQTPSGVDMGDFGGGQIEGFAALAQEFASVSMATGVDVDLSGVATHNDDVFHL
jgi:hypothetical protein